MIFLKDDYFYAYGSDNPKVIIYQPVMLREIDKIEEDYNFLFDNHINKNILLVYIKINDWNKELSPFENEAVFGNEKFSGKADEFIEKISYNIFSKLDSELQTSNDIIRVIGGYSLAGLFSLYFCYKADYFNYCMAASPSVWFDGWKEYVSKNKINADFIYLSLGDREHICKNTRMQKVKENIEYCNEIYGKEKAFLEFNKGNHFCDVNKRIKKGYDFLLKKTLGWNNETGN